ncbi:MAG: hypothetical protein H7070_06275 [Saprospiraceae bacterium]|nr:hypothetical protein [Pyrinomonadaceae bacterium]
MKSVGKCYSVLFLVMAAIQFRADAQSTVPAMAGLSSQDRMTVADLEKRVREYTELRERLELELPKLSKEATPEQIESHKTALQKSVLNARAGSKHEDVFTPAAAKIIRTIIKSGFKGDDRADLRKTVLEAENKGIPLKINIPYPEDKEFVEMSPTLLQALPKLPKQLRYRFAGRNMLLVDRENGLIVDYMTNAIP